VEGHSTVEDRRPRNSYHRFCYVFAARAASACHWNWTAIGVDFRGGTKRGTAVLGLGSTGLGFQLVLVPQYSSPTLFCTNSAFHKVVW